MNAGVDAALGARGPKPVIAYMGAPEGFEALEQLVAGRAKSVHVQSEPEALASILERASGVLDASMRVPLSDAMVAGAPFLRIISCATTGSDHVARSEASKRDIAIRTLREDPELLSDLTPAAELSWALLMACARRLPAALAHVQAGEWTREKFPGVMLNGRKLGIIGLGRIGVWMARYAQAFGMEVAAYDPHAANMPDGVRQETLNALFRESDFVTVHVHLSDETRGLVSRSLLKQCKPGAVLINTSRGAIVDEVALLSVLEDGRLAAAGLDVLQGEPDVADHPLVRYARIHSNLLITPHMGGFSPDAVRVVCRRAAEKIVEHLGL